jgi:hypothetical protein
MRQASHRAVVEYLSNRCVIYFNFPDSDRQNILLQNAGLTNWLHHIHMQVKKIF